MARLSGYPDRRVKPSGLCWWGRRSLPGCLGTAARVAGEKSSLEAHPVFVAWECLGEAVRATSLRDLLRPSWWCSGAAPSSTGVRGTATVTSRLRSCRLCQQLQLAWGPSWLNNTEVESSLYLKSAPGCLFLKQPLTADKLFLYNCRYVPMTSPRNISITMRASYEKPVCHQMFTHTHTRAHTHTHTHTHAHRHKQTHTHTHTLCD